MKRSKADSKFQWAAVVTSICDLSPRKWGCQLRARGRILLPNVSFLRIFILDFWPDCDRQTDRQNRQMDARTDGMTHHSVTRSPREGHIDPIRIMLR